MDLTIKSKNSFSVARYLDGESIEYTTVEIDSDVIVTINGDYSSETLEKIAEEINMRDIG